MAIDATAINLLLALIQIFSSFVKHRTCRNRSVGMCNQMTLNSVKLNRAAPERMARTRGYA